MCRWGYAHLNMTLYLLISIKYVLLIFVARPTGKPQRMNGKVNGRIYVGSSSSPIELSNNDLHSYVVVNDGRAYVAISSIPASVGHSLQPLASLGGIIGWAFALEQPGYENGFSIIGKRTTQDVNKFM